nr:OstA-like protein [Sphingobacterium sp. lm-10]
MRHYNPVYEHKSNTLMADSGDFWRDEVGREFFEAYGNVVITQPSGTVIYGDRLHYEAATQHAVLTRNVRVVDQQSVLTTNYLTYSFRDQRGTYTGGGRIVSGLDTITSRNAYYFERTKDSYFREKVVVRSPDVVIYTDTMRYNSITRDNYFFGPTNIKGRSGENLYTERGVYNTGTGIAKFNLNNLYTEGSKFLKGDSLYYDRSIGDGEAFRNVVFVDTLEKFYANGGYGKYRSREESITMADKPLVKMVVDNDTTSRTPTDSIANTAPDEDEKLSRRERRQQRQREQAEQESLELLTDSLSDAVLLDTVQVATVKNPVDTVYLTADTIFSRTIPRAEYIALDLGLSRDGGQLIVDEDVDYGDDDDISANDSNDALDPAIPPVSGADSVTTSNLENAVIDTIPAKVPPRTTIRPPDLTKKTDSLTIANTLKADSTLRDRVVIPQGNEAGKRVDVAMETVMRPDSLASPDSVMALSDTVRTRIVKAYRKVRMFKSDLQAVADSVYYGMQDSMFRFMGKPMIWSDGSQISADTIFMQMVNRKLDNALLKDNAFMVNAVLDSVKFNQLKGRKITAFFDKNYIERLFVDGNAENLVFNVDEPTGIIRDMFHDRGARIKIVFLDRKVFTYNTFKPNQQLYPLKLVTQENEILPGFLWRPQDRPKSLEDMMIRTRDTTTPVTEEKPSEDEGRPIQRTENTSDGTE